MKRLVTFLCMYGSAVACSYPDFGETKSITFFLKNTGVTTYSNIIIYAKDSSGMYVDSTSSSKYFPGIGTNPPNKPYSLGMSVGIPPAALKDIYHGVFEIQAPILNGRFLRQDFGSINGNQTKTEFHISLMDSTFIIK